MALWKWARSHLQPNRLPRPPAVPNPSLLLKKCMLFSSISIGGSRYPGILGSLKEVSNLEILKLLSIIGLFYFTTGRGLAVPSCTSWPFWEPNPFHLVRVIVTQYRAKVKLSIKVSWIIIIAVGLRWPSQFHHYRSMSKPQTSLLACRSFRFSHTPKPSGWGCEESKREEVYKIASARPELKRRRYSSAHSKNEFSLMRPHNGDAFLWTMIISGKDVNKGFTSPIFISTFHVSYTECVLERVGRDHWPAWQLCSKCFTKATEAWCWAPEQPRTDVFFWFYSLGFCPLCELSKVGTLEKGKVDGPMTFQSATEPQYAGGSPLGPVGPDCFIYFFF